MIWSALLLIALFLLPGYGAWLAFSDEGRRHLSAVEGLFIISLTGLITATLSAFILAELGLFKLPLLLILLGIFALGTAAWGIFKRGRSPNPLSGLSFQFIDLAPFFLLALAFLLSPQAFEYIVGGRDHGVYFNTGVNIARTGQILIIDPELGAIPPESRVLLINPDVSVDLHGLPGPWSEGQRLPGLTIRDASQGIILPHAFHLYPALIAIFYALGGLSFGLSTTMVLALFGSLAFYFAGRRLFGPAAAILALFFVILNVGQMWFTRYPTAEILTRLLFWSGLYTVGLLLTKGGRFTAVIAGLCFGLMHLAKLDTFMVTIVLFLFFTTLWLRRRWSPNYTSFVIAYLGITVLALIHAYFLATIYFIDQSVRDLLPPFLAQPLIEAASGRPYPVDSLRYLALNNQLLILLTLFFLTATFVLAIRFRDSINGWLSRIEWLGPWATGALMAVLGLLTIYSLSGFQVITLEQIRVTQASINKLGWYLTPLGLILGMVGLAKFVVTSRRPDKDLTWMLIVGSALPLLLLGPLTAIDHFWAIRRYVPIVIPALLLFAAYLLIALMPRSRDKWLRAAVPIILSVLLVVGMWGDTSKVYGVVEYEGLTEKLEDFAGYFPPESVLLFEDSDTSNRLTLPLWLIWDQTIFSLPAKSLTQPAFAAAVDYWLAQDRDVFWLTTGGIDTDIVSEHYYNYDNSFDFVLPLIERIKSRIPAKEGQIVLHLDAYKIQSEPFPKPLSAVTIDSGSPSLDEPAGLYEPEVISGLSPLRWGGESITLTFPIGNQPVELLLEVSSPRPDKAPPAEVSMYSGDLLLTTFIVGPVASLYRIKIPSDLKFNGPTVDFRIDTVPWVPAQVIGSQDQRPLGLIFYWAELIFEG